MGTRSPLRGEWATQIDARGIGPPRGAMKHWQAAGDTVSSAADTSLVHDCVDTVESPGEGDKQPCTTLSRLYGPAGSGGDAGHGAQLLALFQSLKPRLTNADCVSLVPLLSALQATPAGGSYPVSPAVRSLGASLSGTGAPFPETVQRLLSPLASWFTDLHSIGRGGFGSVFSATSVLDGRQVALKRVAFRSPVPPWAPPAALAASNAPALREIRALATLSHQHIVKYYTAWTEPRFEKMAGMPAHASTAAPPSSAAPQPRLTWHDAGDADAGPDWSATSSGASSSDSLSGSASTWHPQHPPLLLEAAPHTHTRRRDAPVAMAQQLTSRSAALWPWTLYVAMELCTGPTLGEWLSTGPRATGDVLTLVAQVAQGLAHMHRQGVRHRDIKPANIIVECPQEAGVAPRAVIVDLGLAALTDVAAAPWVVEEDEGGSAAGSEGDTAATAATPGPYSSGSDGHHTRGVGTATYAAPEQLLHSAGREPGPWSDIYSLGLVLVECLASPFATAMERADTLVGARAGRLPPRMEELAPGSSALAAAMLHPVPRERPSAAEVARSRVLSVAPASIDALRGAVAAKARELAALERQLAVAMAVEA